MSPTATSGRHDSARPSAVPGWRVTATMITATASAWATNPPR